MKKSNPRENGGLPVGNPVYPRKTKKGLPYGSDGIPGIPGTNINTPWIKQLEANREYAIERFEQRFNNFLSNLAKE